jgi:hypothetical protein
MTVTFENDPDIIVYALEKIISYARNNQYIFQAQSIWWISSIIRLQQELIIHIDNLKTRLEIALQKDLQPSIAEDHEDCSWAVSTVPQDNQEDPRLPIEVEHIHPDRIPQVGVTIHNLSKGDSSNLDLDNSQEDQLSQIANSTEQFIQLSRKERRAFNKQKKVDQLSRTRSGKVITKPLSNKQRNYLQSIPKAIISMYRENRK